MRVQITPSQPGSVSVDKGYNSDVVVRVCQWQQSSIHQLENEGSNPSAPVQVESKYTQPSVTLFVE